MVEIAPGTCAELGLLRGTCAAAPSSARPRLSLQGTQEGIHGRIACKVQNTSEFESAILRGADLPELDRLVDCVAGSQLGRHLAGVRANHVRTPGPRHYRCRRPAWIAQPAMLGSLPFVPRFPADWRFSALGQARVGGADDGFES